MGGERRGVLHVDGATIRSEDLFAYIATEMLAVHGLLLFHGVSLGPWGGQRGIKPVSRTSNPSYQRGSESSVDTEERPYSLKT